jgi:hypothetical protein
MVRATTQRTAARLFATEVPSAVQSGSHWVSTKATSQSRLWSFGLATLPVARDNAMVRRYAVSIMSAQTLNPRCKLSRAYDTLVPLPFAAVLFLSRTSALHAQPACDEEHI